MLKKLFSKLNKTKADKNSLITSIATRDNINVGQMIDILPDPDQILKKMGKTSEVFEQIRKDPHVMSCTGSRKSGTKSLEYRIDQGKASDKTVELIEDVFELLPMHNIISQILDAPFYGFQALEVNWQYIKPYYVPIQIE